MSIDCTFWSKFSKSAESATLVWRMVEQWLQPITVTDERNVRQFPLAEVFILLFFICVWDTCKIKSAFILSPGDRGWEGVRLIPNCLQKPRKCAFFLGNMRKKISFFEVLETKGVGE